MQEYLVQVKGIVQGVGFRPFVYKLAVKLNLTGYVNNDDQGVNIVLQGEQESIDSFFNELKHNPPVLSKVTETLISQRKAQKTYNTFEIVQSQNSDAKSTQISSDIGICDDCLDEMNDVNNRRYGYAFTNCINCGPRYSIIQTVPYDRVHTSMKKFIMCKACQKEYEDPTNRRYHAQAICCCDCGPKIKLYDNQNQELRSGEKALDELVNRLMLGDVVAIKGLGGFHLVCDASSNYAVKKLRQRKNRPTKPFAVMCKNSFAAQELAIINAQEMNTLCSNSKPIVLLKKQAQSNLSHEVAPKIDRVGLFLPYTPLHVLLLNKINKPLVATSANLSDEPIIRKKEDLIQKLGFVVDYILDFDREIVNACDDSVVHVVNNHILKLRNARGFTPAFIKLPHQSKKSILALGANQKSAIALTLEDSVVLSAHIGDLNSIEAMEYFNRTIETFKKFYDFSPELIVCDKHPSYETTKWAKAQNIPLVQIQHHYAHVLSCMAEYQLNEKVLAFAFDGTGYGDDGNIWGGEVFIASKKEYVRIKHFKYFKLLGGELAIKQIKRLGLSLLFENYSLQELLGLNSPCLQAFSNKEIELLHTVWNKGLNAPLTSSVGRLFDAVCSLAGLEQNVSYEGESGLLIEQCYDETLTAHYEYDIHEGLIDISKAIRQIVSEHDASTICTKFMNMLVEIMVEISNENPSLPVVFTGGVFQNKTLLQALCKRFDALNKTYYYSQEVPLNDAGIALGQIYSQI